MVSVRDLHESRPGRSIAGLLPLPCSRATERPGGPPPPAERRAQPRCCSGASRCSIEAEARAPRTAVGGRVGGFSGVLKSTGRPGRRGSRRPSHGTECLRCWAMPASALAGERSGRTWTDSDALAAPMGARCVARRQEAPWRSVLGHGGVPSSRTVERGGPRYSPRVAPTPAAMPPHSVSTQGRLPSDAGSLSPRDTAAAGGPPWSCISFGPSE